MNYRNSLCFAIIILSLGSVLVVETYSDHFRVDCGSDRNTTLGNRTFMGDSFASKFLNTHTNILANTSKSIGLDLYKTARIFNASSSYKFPINKTGRYILRLYFSPFTYLNYNLNNSKFSVSYEQYIFLSDYTPTLKTIREYSFVVHSLEIEIIIQPTMNSFAYLNALEFFLAPEGLIKDDATLINPKEAFKGIYGVALETVFRVNMGGPTITYDEDTLWRTWESDDRFLEHKSLSTIVQRTKSIKYKNGLASEDIAPFRVYETCRRVFTRDISNANLNVTWNFDIDIGSQYLVRFHYCDIVSKSTNKLIFNVFVDSWIISRMIDLSVLTNGSLGVPVYKDFVTPLSRSNKLVVSIGPIIGDVNNPDGILNGLEIMKISDSHNPLHEGSDLHPFKKSSKNVLNLVVGVVLVLVFLFIVNMFVCRGSNRSTTFTTTTNNNTNTTFTNVVSNTRHSIPFSIIQEATNDFDHNLILGKGGFGVVYKGTLKDGKNIAVKRGYVRSQQDQKAFQNELEMLSEFRHNNLVSMIGYCTECNENVLVFDFMENGCLRSHLYSTNQQPCLNPLSWTKRLEVCIEAARGIEYLHNGKHIIHRDIKPTNILLDENLVAKVADFGLSKARDKLDQDHISTLAIRGTIGYIDPAYVSTYKVTVKSDVYSFGVVLFEVLCGRPVNIEIFDSNKEAKEKEYLIEWAVKCHDNGEIDKIIDPFIQSSIDPESLKIYADLAQKCVSPKHQDRPTMSNVMSQLELALHCQKVASNPEHTVGEASTSGHNPTTTDDSEPLNNLFYEMVAEGGQ